jgi:DNA-binding LytR/AlgR family response regulator
MGSTAVRWLNSHGSETLVRNRQENPQYILSPFPAVIPGAGFNNMHRESVELQPASFPGSAAQEESDTGKVSSTQAARIIEMLPRLEGLLAKTSKIAIKSKGNIFFVDAEQIAFVEARGNHVLFQGPSESHRLRESISTVARKLEPCGFIRIHRSILVNTVFVEGIRSRANNRGEHRLYIKGGKELTVSRSHKKNLKSIAQFWVGTNGTLTD